MSEIMPVYRSPIIPRNVDSYYEDRNEITGISLLKNGINVYAMAKGRVVGIDRESARCVSKLGHKGMHEHLFVRIKQEDGLYAKYTHVSPNRKLDIGANIEAGETIGRIIHLNREYEVHLHCQVSKDEWGRLNVNFRLEKLEYKTRDIF